MKEAWLAIADLTLLKKLNFASARVADNYPAIFHLVNPIASFGDRWIMRGKEQCFSALLHNILQ